MANAFSKEEIVFFEQVLEGFDPNNITARQVMKYQPPSTTFERSALTVHRPLPYISVNKDGLTLVSADFADMTQLSVPSTLNANASAPSDIKNVPFTMNAIELNDPQQRDRKARSAIQTLSALVDNLTATEVANKGTLFIKDTGASGITTYGQVAACEEQMTIRDLNIMDERTIIMNPADYNTVAGALASTDKVQVGVGADAFQRSRIPRIATFESFKANFMPTITAATAGAVTVSGNQKYVPVATDANGNNVDNRTMTLTVNTTATFAAGDAFTIGSGGTPVNSIGMIHKSDTGQLQTFRVISITDGTNMVISPPIITGTATQAEAEYANCSSQAVTGDSLTKLNTVTAPGNIFFQNKAVEIIHGSLATMDLDGAGVSTMRESTDSGIEILFAKGADIKDLGTEYRLTMWMAPNVLNPEMCGVLVANQT